MYTAKWVRHGKVLDSATFDERGLAIQEAINRFPGFVEAFGATSAEVWDGEGTRHLLHVGDH